MNALIILTDEERISSAFWIKTLRYWKQILRCFVIADVLLFAFLLKWGNELRQCLHRTCEVPSLMSCASWYSFYDLKSFLNWKAHLNAVVSALYKLWVRLLNDEPSVELCRKLNTLKCFSQFSTHANQSFLSFFWVLSSEKQRSQNRFYQWWWNR
jgi:hypothetical protein